jgi:hypothetical protein
MARLLEPDRASRLRAWETLFLMLSMAVMLIALSMAAILWPH